MNQRGRRSEKPVETFTTGLAFTVIFGVLLAFFHGAWWWVFPLVFAGVMPMVRGLTGLVARRGAVEHRGPPTARIEPRELSGAEAEKQILRVAKEEGGRVTPALAALKTSLSMERAEEILQQMAARGYATMQVSDEGRVEYQFPEFSGPPQIGGP